MGDNYLDTHRLSQGRSASSRPLDTTGAAASTREPPLNPRTRRSRSQSLYSVQEREPGTPSNSGLADGGCGAGRAGGLLKAAGP